MESRYIGELVHTVFCKIGENMTVITIATQTITKDHTYFCQISTNQNVTYRTFFWNAFILIGFYICCDVVNHKENSVYGEVHIPKHFDHKDSYKKNT